ncbi:hypothetical protein FA95DRAFT_1605497 [Auriscalpium vulgare]|uniref:Uncharacterized protein n=1 Tax=Auriscalpium vulgare TaxID=40419 RepID=A0ACB8RWH3_9AGAM|nr:hypothetical protein FA95DRAFT_1605497 [Auriscalpium vulgare]
MLAHDLELSNSQRPYINLTGYCILTLLFIIGVGTGKAIAAFLGESTVPTVLEWLLGVIFAVISTFLAWVDTDADPPIASWFFERDFLPQIRTRGIYTGIIGGVIGGEGMLFYIIHTISHAALKHRRPDLEDKTPWLCHWHSQSHQSS